MNKFDLQIQSTASDGRHAPAEILKMAKAAGLSTIALTDHDTVAGLDRAFAAGLEQGIRVIPGMELSVEERGVHILGFGIDRTSPQLLTRLEEFGQSRLEGARQMVENLRRAGFAVEWSDVQRQATGAVVARPHIARAILGRAENKQKLGGVASVHDFIEAFLSNENPNYVHRAHISAADGISLIHQAGAVAVWSHPAIHFRDSYEGLEKFLKQLIEWGVEGIEIFSPSHTEDDVEFLNGLSAKYKLLRTGGSDFHEKGEHPADERGLHAARLPGDFQTHGFPTEDIITRLDQAMEKRHSYVSVREQSGRG